MNTNIEKQKKMLLVLPLLVIPFITMMFWALGGGRSSAQTTGQKTAGLNMQLPGAHNKKDSAENKLSLYEQAAKDSMKFNEARKDDPYYHGGSDSVAKKPSAIMDSGIIPKSYGSFGNHLPAGMPNSSSSQLEENERQISLKLAAINRQINQSPSAPAYGQQETFNTNNPNEEQLAKLQAKLQQANTNNTPDPQLQQLSDMLDKIADVENPAIAREKLKTESEKKRGQVFAIATNRPENNISILDNIRSNPGIGNGFYSLDETTEPDSQNTVSAVIATTQTLVNGSTVKLRLTNDIYINGNLIPQNTFVYGVASLSGERLEIKISNVRYQHSLYPVSLSVFDLDGLNGVYIPGAITRDVAKESADQSIQNLGMMSYDPSLGAQAATAGITAAKTLFSRKVRLVKVTVKAGYEVLLRDDKQKQLGQ